MIQHKRFLRLRDAAIFFLGVLCAVVLSPTLRAQDLTIDLDPAATQIGFTLSATMHTVHGAFKLKSGRIHFDPSTGGMGGAIVVDATSGDTENKSRDAKMHHDVLASQQFPEIVFTPKSAKGPLAQMLNQQKPAQFEVSGTFRLRGQDHDATLTMYVQPGSAGKMNISTQFPVPYAAWGLKNPSTLVLHVGDTVNLDVHTTGQIVGLP
jgi:polyisoprenoid-binding protein YceI